MLPLQRRPGKVLIVEPTASVRQMISDVVRAFGFADIVAVPSGRDALAVLETESVHWLIMPLMADGQVNAMQILKLITEYQTLKTVRTSLLIDEAEQGCVRLAFELGLMSWHRKTYSRDEFKPVFVRRTDWRSAEATY